MNSTVIRKATPADVPSMLRLINNLAAYEKAANEVALSEAQLLDDGFGDHPAFSALVAEVAGEVVGMALYYPRYSTWKGRTLYLEDLVVDEPHRRKGIGRALLLELIRIADASSAARLEWQVLDWNEPAIAFYRELGVAFDDEWLNCRLTSTDLKTILKKEL